MFEKKKIIVLFSLVGYILITISCKANKEINCIEVDKYNIVNEVLNTIELKHHDSIAFDPLSNNKAFRRYNLNVITNSGLYSSCNLEKLRDWLENFSFENFQNKMFSENIKWNSNKITNPKVKIGFSLKRKKSIERYNNEKDKAQINRDFDRDYLLQMYWSRENNEPIIQVSNPIFSKKNNYAILFTSSVHFGHEAWVLRRKQEKWQILCNKQIAL